MKVSLINSPRLFFKGIDFAPTNPPLGIYNLYGYLKKNRIDANVFDLDIILMENHSLYQSFGEIDPSLSIEEFEKNCDDIINKAINLILSKIDIQNSNIIAISLVESHSIKLVLPLMRQIKQIYHQYDCYSYVNKRKCRIPK